MRYPKRCDAMIWKEHYKIHSQYTDRNCRMTLPSMAQLFQDSAEAHTNAVASDYFAMLEDGTAWVLSRICYEILQYPTLYQDCEVHTWSRGVEGVFALRDFEFYNAENQLLVRGTSKWVVIDINSRRLLRMGDRFMHGYEPVAKRAIDYDLGKMAVCPDLQTVNTLEVPFSAIDKAQHVNNSLYLRWIYDNVEPEDLGKPVKFIEINYIHETQLGEQITVNRFKDGDTYHFSIGNSKGTGFVCKMQMAE